MVVISNGNQPVPTDIWNVWRMNLPRQEQCMPYIGYPRSVNAMYIIDEVAEMMQKKQNNTST